MSEAHTKHTQSSRAVLAKGCEQYHARYFIQEQLKLEPIVKHYVSIVFRLYIQLIKVF